MIHLGDITKISGYEAPICDGVCGGSPCQDLSVAGKRAGLRHADLGDDETTRSGLFMEQVRIIKEMRDRDRKNGRPEELVHPRYKALGNSIALPFWRDLAKRICAQYDRQVTIASLFDGIGGFPLAFEEAGAKAVWASEIEEFPIAVTKLRFPEPEDDLGCLE